MPLQLIDGIIRELLSGQRLGDDRLGHSLFIPDKLQFLLLQVNVLEGIPLGQPCLRNGVAVAPWVPPVAVLTGGHGQRSSIDFLQLLEGQRNGCCGLSGKVAFELDVFPGLCDLLLVPPPLGRGGLDILQRSYHIVGPESGRILHDPHELELVLLTQLMAIGRIFDGRRAGKVELDHRPVLVRQDWAATVVAQPPLPLPDGPVGTVHILDGSCVSAGLHVVQFHIGVGIRLHLVVLEQECVLQPDQPDALILGERIAVPPICLLVPVFCDDLRSGQPGMLFDGGLQEAL